MAKRIANISRKTGETSVQVEFNIDGSGQYNIATGVKILDHFLSQLARHGLFDITISASGDDQHHVVEDVAICLGRAFNKALGEKKGITRMGYAVVPMDEALAAVAVDIGGRAYSVVEVSFIRANIGELYADLVRHFFESLASEAKMNLHAKVLTGINDHHKAEALFKALGRALDSATRIDKRVIGKIPSTKNVIE
jgi:imidazoleglycerol-phosphate dehydratase